MTVQSIPSGFRQIRVLQTDTLQRIALRELGDASRWPDVAQFNNLHPPYISADPGYASDPQVVAPGATILVPSSTSQVSSTSGDDIFGTDLVLNDGELNVANGDLATVSGVANVDQALGIRVSVVKEELVNHPEYGCWIRRLIGTGAGPTTAQLAALYVTSSLNEDDRVQSASGVTVVVRGDRFSISGSAPLNSSQAVSNINVSL
ncbi:hypothetical protein [Burkholderia sp. Ac-20349]|uniref:hypothetical protein n=1 Tax=Burkholderia sp. Ac-20349 TaxID=2703893 RepID=UPI00197BE248|nr:hypothetical protein [Burkholderia sp. Ac-20349]MBN3839267.1 hypothetical protein [Burkholderia sp. Ac-20349]